MNPLLLNILCVLILTSTYTFAEELPGGPQVIQAVVDDPRLAVEMALLYPSRAEEIKKAAIANSYKLPTRERVNATNFDSDLAKANQWEGFACGQEGLPPETQSEWPNKCTKWFSENSDNPATTNSAQNESFGIESARRQGVITNEQANKLNAQLASDGSEFFYRQFPASGK